MLSGSVGVVITLLLTGWWNWSERKATNAKVEQQALFNFARLLNELARDLEFIIDDNMTSKIKESPYEIPKNLHSWTLATCDTIVGEAIEMSHVVNYRPTFEAASKAVEAAKSARNSIHEYGQDCRVGHDSESNPMTEWRKNKRIRETYRTIFELIVAFRRSSSEIFDECIVRYHPSSRRSRRFDQRLWRKMTGKPDPFERRDTPAADADPNE